MKFIISAFLGVLLGSTALLSAEPVDQMLFDNTSGQLGKAIVDSGVRQSAYAYNLANVATPGFKPVFFPEDRLFADAQPKGDLDTKDSVEFFMSKMTENRSRQAAYVKLYNIKMGIVRQVVTLGKR